MQAETRRDRTAVPNDLSINFARYALFRMQVKALGNQIFSVLFRLFYFTAKGIKLRQKYTAVTSAADIKSVPLTEGFPAASPR